MSSAGRAAGEPVRIAFAVELLDEIYRRLAPWLSWQTRLQKDVDELEGILCAPNVGTRELLDGFFRHEMARGSHTWLADAPTGAYELLRALEVQGAQLYALTCRSAPYMQFTEAWLSQVYPGIFRDRLVSFSSPLADLEHTMLREFCEQQNIQVVVTDRPDHVDLLSHMGVAGVLFGWFPWTTRVAESFLTYDRVQFARRWDQELVNALEILLK